MSKRINGANVPVYDRPIPHMLWEDLRLAMDSHNITMLEVWLQRNSTADVTGAVTVTDYDRFNTRKPKGPFKA